MEPELVVLDTNVLVNAYEGSLIDSRVMKDAKNGNNFKYGLTIHQQNDLANSKSASVRRYYNRKFSKDLKEYNLELLDPVRVRRNPVLQKILKSTRGIERSDVETVHTAISAGAKFVVTNDNHLTWQGINEVIKTENCLSEISLLKPTEFCNEYCNQIEDLSMFDKLSAYRRRFLRKIGL